MNKLLLILATFVATTSCSLAIMLPIRGVTDGDTIKTSLPLACPLCNASIRVNGIDTPESLKQNAKCAKELALGIQAKEFMKTFVGTNTTMSVTSFNWDKYGGRIVGTVNIDGKDAAQTLIAAGLAKPYTGTGAKPDWCQ